MPAIFLTVSPQPPSHLPSRIAPNQEGVSIQSGVMALIITGAIAVGVVSLIGWKHYQRYHFRQNIKMLERAWLKHYRKPIK
jgi:hypothetical protein